MALTPAHTGDATLGSPKARKYTFPFRGNVTKTFCYYNGFGGLADAGNKEAAKNLSELQMRHTDDPSWAEGERRNWVRLVAI